MSTQQTDHTLNHPAEHPADQPLDKSAKLLSDQYQALIDDMKNKAKTNDNQGIKADNVPAKVLEQARSGGLDAHIKIIGERAELLDTAPPDPAGTRIGPSNPDEVIRVTVMVKSKASEKEMDQTIEQIAEGKRKPLTDSEYNAQFGADPAAMDRVVKFAKRSNLTVANSDLRSGQVELDGTIQHMSSAFNVLLEDYKDTDGDTTHREQVGNVIMPRTMVTDIQGVFGLDNRRQAKPLVRFLPHDRDGDGGNGDGGDDDGPAIPLQPGSQMPNEVADQYKFPKESMGAGQSVGIVELGGGLDQKDNAQYYKDHNLKLPKIQEVGVDGARSTLGSKADGEVAIDSQIIGAIAPDANQQLVFAPNSDQGFVDSITRATFPEQGEAQNSAITISWGYPEPNWTAQTLSNMHLAFKKAALKGISVFAASGDWGAHDMATDGSYSTIYPASDPLVTGTGGTKLDSSGNEVAWNDSGDPFPGGASGGGISQRFSVPDFQMGVKLPADANGTGRIGRGVPDIAGNASQDRGYIIRFGGKEVSLDGTSCVAPLYSALMMRVNGALGHPVGDLNPFLYKHGKLAQAGLEPSIFNNITEGDNDGYYSAPGWNAVTGLGSIKGDQFLKRLRQDNM